MKGKYKVRTDSTDDGCSAAALILTLSIKVNITVTLHTVALKSLALVSGNAQRVNVLLGPAGRISISLTSSFFLVCLLEALPTCVIVWPLSACLLQSAVLCGSPHPSCTLARCLPADPYRLASLLFRPTPHPSGLQAKSSSFRTGPHVLRLLLLLRQSLSSATSTSTLSVSLLQSSL